MMKILLILTMFYSMSVSASSSQELQKSQEPLGARIKKVIKKNNFNEAQLGIYIEDNKNVLFDLNADKKMIPASLTKIVTAGAVLSAMPFSKKFTTELWTNGIVKESTLEGSLCFKGGGDPSFVSEKMWFLINEFTRTGITKINGDLIIDATRFDNELFDKGRDSTRVDRAFDAPVSAASFNWNSVNVYVRPTTVGNATQVIVDPINDYIVLENKTKTVLKNRVNSISVSRISKSGVDKIIVSGELSKESSEIVFYKSISSPEQWVASHLKEFLKQRNITLSGNIKIGSCNMGSVKLASVDSKSLVEMVSDMLKYSNNFVAEMLVKNLAAEKNQTNAHMKDGIEELRLYLDQVGLKRKDYVLENVSGLTRDNQFTARQFGIILTSIKNNFLIFPEFLSGLPISGVDGTMRSRLKKSGSPVVRAKTGYLDGVTGLAGYVEKNNQEPIMFVFMFNGSFDNGIASRALYDQLISEIVK